MTTPTLLLFDLGGVLVETPGGRLAREICVGDLPATMAEFWATGGGHVFEWASAHRSSSPPPSMPYGI